MCLGALGGPSGAAPVGPFGGRDDDLPSGGGEDLWGLGGMSVVLSCARQALKGGRFGDNDKTARRVCAVVRV
ncbi:hypothetical protein SRM_01405 [Salinibacter ruber M8]|uniref:Uncharacterized protein n=1 Tax=Salinibacter ruber (strain M8) TaxID=761659 RepID=D5H8H1_SALRM|nr:hypothetical protein SRM_01405 [Salinibacter ruber M8]